MNKVIFSNGNSIFRGVLSSQSSYRASLQRGNSLLTYEVQLEQKGNSVQIEVKNFLINNNPPDLMAEQLAHKAGEALYPLCLSLNRQGDISYISNYEEIKTRWHKLYTKLLAYYVDAYSVHYINQTHRSYTLHSLLKEKLEENYFFFLYFGGIYNQTLGDDFYREYTLRYKGVDFLFSQWVDMETNENNCFGLYREGLQEERNERIELRYLLENKHKSIEEASFSFFKSEKIDFLFTIEKLEETASFSTGEIPTEERMQFWLEEKPENLNH